MILLAAATPMITAAPQVEVPGRAVRVRDVVPGATGRDGERIVAMLPARGTPVGVSRRALAALVRRSLPRSRIAGGEGTVLIRAAAMPRMGACGISTADVRQGQAIAPGSVAPAACTDARSRAVRFDRARGVAVAEADIPAGSYLGPLQTPVPRGVARGTSLRLISIAGPVRVVRQVTTMQASRTKRVFVRDADGAIFAAPLQAEEAE